MTVARFEQVPTWWQQESFKDFRSIYSQQRWPLLFVGSGLSRWAGLPDWASLLRQLARNGTPEAQEEVERLIRDKTYSGYQQAGSLLKNVLGEKKWRQTLREIFTDRELVQAPSQIHNALVTLKWQWIITTNYDRLLEDACKRMEVQFKTRHYGSPELPGSERPHEPCIIHLHGDVTDLSCDLILAKEDYDILYKPNGSGSYYERTVGGTLRQAEVILFLGYSHDDEHVANLFTRALEGIPNTPVFALVPRKERQAAFESRLSEQAQKHHIRYISFSREGAYRELLQLLEYLKKPAELDELYKWQLSVKRPTVVFLRGGGTIGAKSRPAEEGRNLDIDHVKSRFDKDLRDLAATVLKRYRRYSDLPLEIVWEILPPEQQLLSENAVADDWNNVLRKLQSCFLKYFDAPDRVGSSGRIHDPDIHALFMEELEQYEFASPGRELTDRAFMDGFRNRYILGFVLLYGTDTLAYLAPALAFGLRHIPCSVVITGANQPLFSHDITGSGEFDNTSDGWRNLFSSLFFLQCFGHSLTEFFVVFGDTVHHGVNLRKRAVDIIPYDREQLQKADLEPFMYRNLSLTGQYMFRLIDGVFCNNYYAATTQDYHRLLWEHDDLWHVRSNPFVHDYSPAGPPEWFSDCVKYLELSPSFPRIDVGAMLRDKSEIRVVLVEGYNSGTYPSVSTHNFSLFLSDLDRCGIPVVLISRYGIRATQEDYRVLEVNGRPVQVLRLYGMVLETALPLLSLVVGRIKAPEWNIDPDVNSGVDQISHYRRQLVKRELDDFFETRRNILSEELKYSTDRAARFRRMTELRSIEEGSRKAREQHDGSQWHLKRRKAAAQGHRADLVTMPRTDFLDLFEGSVEQFERVGALPDGFSTLSNQGFTLGNMLANSFQEKNRQHGFPFKGLFDRKALDYKELCAESEALIRDVTERLNVSGIAEIELLPLEFGKDKESGRSYFSIEVIVNRGELIRRADERFAMTAFSDQEAEFFAAMHDGCPNDLDLDAHRERLMQLYALAVRATWPHVTHNLDWFILGFLKGVCCALASILGFDQEPGAPQISPSVGRRQVLRQSIQCKPLGIDRTRFKLRFRCYQQAGHEPLGRPDA